jgi:superfamily II DNA/RNA helicase
MSFAELQLAPCLLKAIAECGYTTPTPIQEQAIPKVLAGHDLIASAKTGTGKTAAFILPALQRVGVPSTVKGRGPRILVLTPTRELANQVNDAARSYGKYQRMRSATILGGMPYREQLRMLSQPLDLVVATPGRLNDHLERGRIDLSRVELLILDEADRMLDMGFIEDVERISAAAPDDCQTLLFSATLDARIERLAKGMLHEPEMVLVAGKEVTHVEIEQRLLVADDLKHKNKLLQHLVADSSLSKAIIFSATKRDADMLARELHAQGHRAAALHGDMNQTARNRTIADMRKGRVRLLVATDVAARGLDVTGISHVINFDLPKFAEDYVHRIGRTGRAGASGIAISFASRSEVACLDRIERYTGQSIPQHVIEGLEPTQPLRVPARKRNGQGRSAAGHGDSRFAPGRPFKGRSKSNGKSGSANFSGKRSGTPKHDKVIVEYRSSRPGQAARRQAS